MAHNTNPRIGTCSYTSMMYGIWVTDYQCIFRYNDEIMTIHLN